MFIPDDVLWCIFILNAPQNPLSFSSSLLERLDYWNHWDDAARDRMITIKAISQVCRDWRRVILSSPDFWAKSIDLTPLEKFRDPLSWVREILKRTGQSTIWLHGVAMSPATLSVFLEIVQQCWTRIEILRVDLSVFQIDLEDVGHLADHTGWNRIRDEVSPCLQFFKADHAPFSNTREGFGPTFPSLQNANIQYLHMKTPFQTVESFQVPLFQNLRFLAIEGILIEDPEDWEDFTFSWTLEQLFEVLESTPLLEALYIGEMAVERVQFDNVDPVNLPHLRSLNLTCNIDICLAILLFVKRAPKCSLSLRVSMQNHDLWPTRLQTELLKVAEHIQFSSSILLCPSKYQPAIRYTNSPQDTQFAVEFDTAFGGAGQPFPLFDFLANEQFNFTNVDSLQITSFVLHDFDHYLPSVFQLVMDKFSNVQTLEIGWEYFDIVLNKLTPTQDSQASSQASPFHSNDFFPKLETLVLHQQRLLVTEREAPIQAILDFCRLHRQPRTGLSRLKRLNLYNMRPDDNVNYLLPLLDTPYLDGLVVEVCDKVDGVYTRRTAICGSGKVGEMKVNTGKREGDVLGLFDNGGLELDEPLAKLLNTQFENVLEMFEL